MSCDNCTAGRACKHRNNINLEMMVFINNQVRKGIISPSIKDDLIEKLAGTILEHCLECDKGGVR